MHDTDLEWLQYCERQAQPYSSCDGLVPMDYQVILFQEEVAGIGTLP